MLGVRPPCAQTLADDLLEGEPEVATKEGVNTRIDGRVAVAQPEQDGEENRWDTLRAKCSDYVHGEERHPAHDESANDNTFFQIQLNCT